MIISSTLDFREAARRRLPPFLFHYADGGAYAEETLRRNVADLSDIALRQRVLRNMEDITLSTSLFGAAMPLPVVLGPIGIGGMFRRRGEIRPPAPRIAPGCPSRSPPSRSAR
jgi:L-lactate dehydrogenase (cytochrome)